MSRIRHRSLAFENLQSRDLMAADLTGGELQITGTSANDRIEVSQETRLSLVYQSGFYRLDEREMVRVKISDVNNRVIENRLFDETAVDRIFAQGLGGDDVILNDTDLPSTLYGNDGNDVLRGGSAKDTLVGGEGHDSLYGRGGQDTILGGNGNDGLFGGEGYDLLYGGSGANRYLNTRDGDYLYRPDSNDAVIEFRAGSLGFTFFGYVTGGSWNDEQVEMVDQALNRIHLRTGSTRLLKLSDGSRMEFLHRGHKLSGPATVAAWNDDHVIHVHHGLFTMGDLGGVDNGLLTQQLIIHEMGHFWDDPNENSTVTDFRRISQWSEDGLQHDGDVEEDFARAYGATNAREDFATCFAAHFMQGQYFDLDDGWGFADYTGRVQMQRKLAYMDLFDSLA